MPGNFFARAKERLSLMLRAAPSGAASGASQRASAPPAEPAKPTKLAEMAELRRRIDALERAGYGGDMAGKRAAPPGALPFGAPEIDEVLPWRGLAPGALHEISGPVRDAAAFGFVSALLARLAAGAPGAVLDGRDIGTVICPEARCKIFVEASVEVRARRRLKELQERGVESIYSRVLRDMEERDARDRNRSIAPLVPAEDAYQLDTTTLDADSVFDLAVAFITSQNKSDKA